MTAASVTIQRVCYVLLGPPGAGKSTFGRMLAERRKLRYIYVPSLLYYGTATEEDKKMLRSAWPDYGETEEAIAQNKRDGKSVPTDVLIELVATRLRAPRENGLEHGVILDGSQFPSSVDGAVLLDRACAASNWQLVVILFTVERAVAVQRILSTKRAEYATTKDGVLIPLRRDRTDDNEPTIIKRHKRITDVILPPLRQFYEQSNRLIQRDATNITAEHLFAEIEDELARLLAKL